MSEFNTLFNRLMKNTSTHTQPPQLHKVSRAREAESECEEEELLDEGLVRARTMEDLEALVHDGTAEEAAVSVSHPASVETPSEPHSKKKKEIDPSEVLTKHANMIKVPLAPTLLEGDDGEEEEVSPGVKTRLLLHCCFLLYFTSCFSYRELSLPHAFSLFIG